MLTLGNKEAIVNDPSFVNLAVDGDICTIEHYGVFDINRVTSAFGGRYYGPQYNGLTIEVPTTDELGLVSTDKRIPVIVEIAMSTQRSNVDTPVSSATAGNPFRLEVIVDGSDDSPTIASKIEAALNLYNAEFGDSELPFTFEKENMGNILWLTAKDGAFFFPGIVMFVPQDIVPLQAVTYNSTPYKDETGTVISLSAPALTGATSLDITSTYNLRVGDELQFKLDPTTLSSLVTVESINSATNITVTAVAEDLNTGMQAYIHKVATTAVFDGKYLEENVTMGTPENSIPYAIAPGEVPLLLNKYTTISFEVEFNIGDGIGGADGFATHNKIYTAVADGDSTGTFKLVFTLYFDEETCLEAGGPVDQLVSWLGSSANVTLSDSFYLENGNTAATSGEFIA